MAALKVPQVDTDTMRDIIRDVSRDLSREVDLSRLAGLKDELGRLDLSRVGDLRDVRRRIGRPDPRIAWSAPTITPAVVLGSAMVIAGVVLGGVLAWLYQPGVGRERRFALRRRLHRMQRSLQHRY